MAILKLRRHNENKEIEFELKYLGSLTTKQRFQMMVRKSREMFNILNRHGYRKTAQVTKRT